MVVRRKKSTTGKKLSAVAEPLPQPREEKPAEEAKSMVTQVVEVVEEVEEVPTTEESPTEEQKEPTQEVESKEEEVSTHEVATEEAVGPDKNQETESEQPAKRKEMVEELYTSRKETTVMPEISMHKNKSMHPMVVWAIVTIIVALLSGGMLFAVTKKMVSMPSFFAKPTPTPTPAPTATPTPTPAPVDKAALKIQVLNGGGTPGAASKMKKVLENAGYKVAATGNTDEYTYDTTEIHGKDSMKDAITALQADLKDSYALGTVSTDLSSDSSYDVQIIVGKE